MSPARDLGRAMQLLGGGQGSFALSANLTVAPIAKRAAALKSLKSKDL
jgi:hypothetical protein